ncbi:N-acetyltransferase [Mycolicibacterium peregrinum]|uniref:N-acetyltransferase n=1 Tax=Mycolicibacterium peregrinum TaxID=43304 RepID=A0A1X2BGR5_MYCPR|nr:GNAT family N-acetyltransferase [Mycolicibacterium peregrinum]MCV7206936.1 GNAT family N-acetyltransferase [Mycolicibacterium peregrinum]ORW62731.1 acetyltransferase [Mycolicibacterium peregrinum]OWL99112.1 N-acetyltransferase [Mycolicibacterium peregrinum]TGB42538.1 N-acetyltransferase [Mycolicibacterium peregrinum]TGB43493.1 N-acetyltransferase [Mycolicibacterium peregrinum]
MLTATRVDAERVILRKGCDDDAAGFIETQVDERVRRFLGGPRPEPDVRSMVAVAGAATLLAVDGCYVVADRESDEMLGMVTLGRRGPELPGHLPDGGGELELSYVFRATAWGRGYATEAARALLRCAAEQLVDQPIIIVTQAANQAALRLADRLGFTRVGAFEQFNAEQVLATASLGAFLRH